jgi:uncharacterized protein YdeI (YjbR/CyaY-like superfamily)
MTKSATNPKVDAFFGRLTNWREEMERLRAIALDCQLAEDLKWGQPTYTLDGRNVLLMHGFKEYCALLFMKGALMKDPNGILIQQTENVQSARQIRFTNSGEIGQLEPAIRAYIKDAIELTKSGAKLQMKTVADFKVAEEFQARLDADPKLKAAFEALTPGRQKSWLLHFAQPKQSKTREARIDKATPKIFAGKGMLD